MTVVKPLYLVVLSPLAQTISWHISTNATLQQGKKKRHRLGNGHLVFIFLFAFLAPVEGSFCKPK